MQTTNSHPVHRNKEGKMRSANGHSVDFNKPWETGFDINDIAIGLSNVCRFAGQVKNFYSVAQHSLFVMHLAPTEFKKVALMHDASEAYLGDVVKPLKNILGSAYERIEETFMREIANQHGFDVYQMDRIKEFDKMALELEYEALKKGNPTPLLISMNMHDMMEGQQHCFWDNITARTAFLDAYNKLFK